MALIFHKINSGERLDKILKARFPQFSRHWVQKLIKTGMILVNGKLADPDYRLKPNDNLTFKNLSLPLKIEIPKPDPKIKFKVIYEDKDCAAIEKPSGLVVHPSETVRWGTLVNGLLHRWPQLEGVGEDPMRPGIVHRLDKETSGVMIIAKTQPAFEHLKKQFQNRLVHKKYSALLIGKTPKLKGEINAPIGRSKNDPLKQSVSGIKEAITAYEVVRRYQKYTLVEAWPKTGRTHQLRVHFAFIGHPVAGDSVYAPKKVKLPAGLKRLFLHAVLLEITLFKGKKRIFESSLPLELKEILSQIEKTEKSLK